MTTLECMVRVFEAELAKGVVRAGREAEGEAVLDWKEPAAARVRERLERRGRGREEKRWKVLENRMVVVDGERKLEEMEEARGLYSLDWELDVMDTRRKVRYDLDCAFKSLTHSLTHSLDVLGFVNNFESLFGPIGVEYP